MILRIVREDLSRIIGPMINFRNSGIFGGPYGQFTNKNLAIHVAYGAKKQKLVLPCYNPAHTHGPARRTDLLQTNKGINGGTTNAATRRGN